MSRKSRRSGQSVMVRGPVMAAGCVEWMRSRTELRSVTDSAGREWEAFWPRTVGTPDLPRWRMVPPAPQLDVEDLASAIRAAVDKLPA